MLIRERRADRESATQETSKTTIMQVESGDNNRTHQNTYSETLQSSKITTNKSISIVNWLSVLEHGRKRENDKLLGRNVGNCSRRRCGGKRKRTVKCINWREGKQNKRTPKTPRKRGLQKKLASIKTTTTIALMSKHTCWARESKRTTQHKQNTAITITIWCTKHRRDKIRHKQSYRTWRESNNIDIITIPYSKVWQ